MPEQVYEKFKPEMLHKLIRDKAGILVVNENDDHVEKKKSPKFNMSAEPIDCRTREKLMISSYYKMWYMFMDKHKPKGGVI